MICPCRSIGWRLAAVHGLDDAPVGCVAGRVDHACDEDLVAGLQVGQGLVRQGSGQALGHHSTATLSLALWHWRFTPTGSEVM